MGFYRSTVGTDEAAYQSDVDNNFNADVHDSANPAATYISPAKRRAPKHAKNNSDNLLQMPSSYNEGTRESV
jgi:hypothetical protein